MSEPLKLMAVTAHPDDESLGYGGVLARYAAEGVATAVVCATRGESGRHGTDGPHPGPEALGRAREAELRAAAAELGVGDVAFLGYTDGALDQAPPVEAISRIADHLLRFRPQVVVTFPPDGAYGHPDHIAISQLAAAAVVVAASGAGGDERPAHAVSKLYYMAWGAALWEKFQKAFKTLTSTVDGVVRRATPWPDWAITTRVDAGDHWRAVWRAVCHHRTQMSIYQALGDLSDEDHAALWGDQTLYRVFSTVNGGRQLETDLFEGLRER